MAKNKTNKKNLQENEPKLRWQNSYQLSGHDIINLISKLRTPLTKQHRLSHED